MRATICAGSSGPFWRWDVTTVGRHRHTTATCPECGQQITLTLREELDRRLPRHAQLDQPNVS